MQELFIIF